MVSAPTTMVIAFVIVCAGLLLSVIRTLKLNVPVWLGVPLIVEPDKDKPFGNEPVVIDQL